MIIYSLNRNPGNQKRSTIVKTILQIMTWYYPWFIQITFIRRYLLLQVTKIDIPKYLQNPVMYLDGKRIHTISAFIRWHCLSMRTAIPVKHSHSYLDTLIILAEQSDFWSKMNIKIKRNSAILRAMIPELSRINFETSSSERINFEISSSEQISLL